MGYIKPIQKQKSKTLTHAPDNYENLLAKVKTTLIEGQQRIEAERVTTYWETGRVIQDHILKHKDRGDYGARVTGRLADDLSISLRLLQRCIQFARTYPSLPKVSARTLFTWTHYRELIAVSDDKKRAALEKAALRNSWSTNELVSRIKEEIPQLKSAPAAPKSNARQAPLAPLRGELYTYKIVERPTVGVGEDSGLLVDLGFGIFRNAGGRLLQAFQKDDVVSSRPSEDTYKFTKSDRTPKDLYTYQAFVEKVIDGDTLKVRFDLGFDTFARQTLRLRGLDCPEMDTKEGQQAKAFVQSHIKEAQKIIVRSSRSDKYDRYLADIFIPEGEESNSETDIYLNNLLLEKEYAVRMD